MKVTTLVPPAEPLKLVVENAAVTPVGNPDTDRTTVALKPFCGVVETES